jgi:hypothetical protein
MMSQHYRRQMLAGAVAVGADGSVDKVRLGIDLLPAIQGLQNTSVGEVAD